MIINTCPTCHQIVDEEDMELCINCEQPLNKYGTCDECNFEMNYPIATSIEKAHIDADRHAQTCDDENCDECNPSA